MSYVDIFRRTKDLCRACLSYSENMIPMENKIYNLEDTPSLIQVLGNLSIQIDENASFPRLVCSTCVDNIRMIYTFRQVFQKSQHILEKYISLNSQLPVEVGEQCKPYNEVSFELDIKNNDDENVSENYNEETKNSEDTEVTLKRDELHETNSKKVNLSHLADNKFVIKRSLNNSLQCKHCFKRFLNKEKLKSHICPKMVTQKCDYCSKVFHSKINKNYHMRLKHSSQLEFNSKIYKCDLCDQVFQTSNARGYHKITRHNTGSNIYPCNICGKTFYIKNSLNQHMDIHNKGVSKVVCPICGKTFHYRSGLFYHMKVHLNERNYICSYCPKKFLNMTSLKRHTRTHTGERPYYCSFCPKSFCSIGEVNTHERRHTGQKPHCCTYCKKLYISPYNLRLHMSSHTGNRPCDLCSKSFLNAEVLKLHMKFKHSDKKDSHVDENDSVQDLPTMELKDEIEFNESEVEIETRNDSSN